MPVNATDAYVTRAPSRTSLRRDSADETSNRTDPKTSAERAIDESTSARTDRTKRVESRPDAGRSDLSERKEDSANGGSGSNAILDANRGRNVNISA